MIENIPFQKIPSSNQIKLWDRFTIINEPIESINLMERAAIAFVKALIGRLDEDDSICVICGSGNNGGDGFAIARLLRSFGYDVDAFYIQTSEKPAPDCLTNMERLDYFSAISEELPVLSFYNLIVDGIFGSGISRPIEGLAARLITSMNQSEVPICSIDMPSGLFSDKVPDSEFIVKSDLTLTFQSPKLSFFIPETQVYNREWAVVNIGLDHSFMNNQETTFFLLDDVVKLYLKPRNAFSHKGNYGHALIIAGSHGKIGAAVMATKACLRSGVGLVTAYVPKCGYTIMQVSVPEAICLTDNEQEYISSLPKTMNYQAIGIGPGLGANSSTLIVIKELFEKSTVPIVMDADALNLLSLHKELIKKIPVNSILTPHPKEFERLVGGWENTFERIEKQKSFSLENKCVVVLKDAYTTVSCPEGNVFINTTGNPGMATGGSGDVLTGILTSLLAQGYDSLKAALIGVYFHGKSGDKAAKKKGQSALIASDIIDHLKMEW
jgi:hydroxyethylthiazole kinase-like uncharacterized protein yjeF